MKPVDVFDIVKQYLTEHADEYDGLACDYVDCGCLTEDLGQCDSLNATCKLGHKSKLDSYGDWILESGPKKKEE